jgi:F420 biosynthesis protein FbiB-like protein
MILAAACHAPSAHNKQPWRFAVLRDPADKDSVARALGDRLRADRLKDGDDPREVELDVARSYTRITGAPVAIVVCLTLEDMDIYPDERRGRAERRMAVQSVAMAGHGLLLAAHAYGLGACWLCAPLFAPEVISRALDLPAAWEAQGLVLLGWPAAPGRARGRKPVEVVTRFL